MEFKPEVVRMGSIEIDGHGKFSLCIDDQSARLTIYEKKGNEVVNRANFLELEDALNTFKKIVQDAQREELKARIDADRVTACDEIEEIRGGQEKLQFS